MTTLFDRARVLGRVFRIIESPPGLRRQPRPGDDAARRFTHWFDGGAMASNAGSAIYEFEDGTRACRTGVPVASTVVTSPDGLEVRIREHTPGKPYEGCDFSAACVRFWGEHLDRPDPAPDESEDGSIIALCRAYAELLNGRALDLLAVDLLICSEFVLDLLTAEPDRFGPEARSLLRRATRSTLDERDPVLRHPQFEHADGLKRIRDIAREVGEPGEGRTSAEPDDDAPVEPGWRFRDDLTIRIIPDHPADLDWTLTYVPDASFPSLNLSAMEDSGIGTVRIYETSIVLGTIVELLVEGGYTVHPPPGVRLPADPGPPRTTLAEDGWVRIEDEDVDEDVPIHLFARLLRRQGFGVEPPEGDWEPDRGRPPR